MMHEAFTKPGAAAGGGCWVDVRDLALAHVRALQKEEAGGERIIITAGAFAWQDWRACFSFSSSVCFPSFRHFYLPLLVTASPIFTPVYSSLLDPFY
jgi:hypothetical protein